jgi:hypothetical protein
VLAANDEAFDVIRAAIAKIRTDYTSRTTQPLRVAR